MHGYILIVGVAIAGIIARVFLLETFHYEDKVAVVEINSAGTSLEADRIDGYQTAETDV